MTWITSEDFDKALLSVTVTESTEAMAPIVEDPKNGLILFPGPYKKNPTWWLRKTVRDALTRAAKNIHKKGMYIQVMDAYRSLTNQKERFIRHVEELKKQFPNLPLRDIQLRANTYIAGIPVLAAHTAGAAVDVLLLDTQQKIADMGCPYITRSEESTTDNPLMSKQVRNNRLLLKSTMEEQGLINFPFEYWHYSLGDVCEAHLTHKPFAKYGPIEFNSITQKTSYPLQHTALYTFFAS
jgi:zinc D-Ala-D-Ala dipeptidase